MTLDLCPACAGTGMQPSRTEPGEWDETLPDCRLCRGEGEVPEIVAAAWIQRWLDRRAQAAAVG